MATVKEVYELALVKMDEVNGGGVVLTEQPEYITKTLSILTSLQIELLPLDATPVRLTSLDDELAVSDRIAYMVLPFGLAAELLLLDNKVTVASYLNNRYDELKKKIPTEIEDIEDVYGVM